MVPVQGLETVNGVYFQEKACFSGCRAEFDVHFQEKGPFLGSWQPDRSASQTLLSGFYWRCAQSKSCEPLGRARATCFEWSALVLADHLLVQAHHRRP